MLYRSGGGKVGGKFKDLVDILDSINTENCDIEKVR